MIVYKTINLINNKIYIGKDTHNNPKYLGSGVILLNAIKKYGKENFKKEILEKCETIKRLNEREIYWIDFYNATNKSIGYNIGFGGEGGDNYKNNPNIEEIKKKISIGVLNSNRRPIDFTKEVREQMSLNAKLSYSKKSKEEKEQIKQKCKETQLRNGTHPSCRRIEKVHKVKQTKRIVSKETKDKISKKLKGRVSPMKGRQMSEESKEKIRKKLKKRVLSEEFINNLKKRNHNRKGIFKHTKESKQKQSIKMLGKTHSSEWIQQAKERAKLKPRKKVYQLDLQTKKVINVFENIDKAAEYLNTKTGKSSINEVINEHKRHYKGFDWCYESSVKLKI